jgi:hypothetical protein
MEHNTVEGVHKYRKKQKSIICGVGKYIWQETG